MHFITIKLKSLFFPIIICIFIICLLLFSSSNISATKNGLALWANSVLPSLLPFFITTELLGYTNVVYWFGNLFKRIMKPIFNVSGSGAFPFVMGIVSGYPIGAKIIANLKKQKILSDIECERLIAFTNNSSLLFILGTVGIALFKSLHTGIILLITHILACLSVGFIFRWWKKSPNENSSHSDLLNNSKVSLISFSNLGEILSTCILSAINTCFLIGGFIVFFSVLISIIENIFEINNPLIKTILFGIIEVTHGIELFSLLPYNNLNLILCSFVLGFGGISVLLQVYSIASKAKISIKPYILGKLLQGSFAALYTFLHLWFTS